MDMYKFISVGLIALCLMGIAYGGFSYTGETWEILNGPLNASVDNNHFVTDSVWTSIATVLNGFVLLVRATKNPLLAALARQHF
jgi:hypothetical protein